MKFNFVKYSKNRNEKFAFSSGHSVLYLLKWLTELHEANYENCVWKLVSVQLQLASGIGMYLNSQWLNNCGD